MFHKDKKFFPAVLLIIIILFFFKDVFLKGLLPLPADTITGLYHPWRDYYAAEYPNGMPYKNFLITDPVRQTYLWRQLTVSALKLLQLPLWNPYANAGTPLLANIQSAPFYPLNIFFAFLPFPFAWTMLVILQPLLGAIFMFYFLQNLKLRTTACFLGALIFSFSGFSIAWLEWNTIIHSLIWLPLMLLSIDKIITYFNKAEILNFKLQIVKLNFKLKKSRIWSLIFISSLTLSFFAGHLQVFFYVLVFSFLYLLMRLRQYQVGKKTFLLFSLCFFLFALITSVSWLPALKFISLSARGSDYSNWLKPGWFIPSHQLLQFIAPDFFGNPATLNYRGVWNYGEMIGYIGIIPLIMAFFAPLSKQRRETGFFIFMIFLSLLLAVDNSLARLPYIFNTPFISTSQPTRLLGIIDFCLAVLAALGLDYFLNTKNQMKMRKLMMAALPVFLVITGAWIYVLINFKTAFDGARLAGLIVARQNLILPTATLSVFMLLIFFIELIPRAVKKQANFTMILHSIIVIMIIGDLFRFGWKFTPFTKQEFLFPSTKSLKFLQSQPGIFRVMTTDSRILPPNFSLHYKIQAVSGYDPLYLRNYAAMVSVWERGQPEADLINFNRIIEPKNPASPFINLLNVKYILSFNEYSSIHLKKVYQEGKTIIYENPTVLPRVYLVSEAIKVKNIKEAGALLFSPGVASGEKAVVQEDVSLENSPLEEKEKAEIIQYEENRVLVKSATLKKRLLVLSDVYYPAWSAYIDGVKTRIIETNIALRGVIVPAGDHEVLFKI